MLGCKRCTERVRLTGRGSAGQAGCRRAGMRFALGQAGRIAAIGAPAAEGNDETGNIEMLDPEVRQIAGRAIFDGDPEAKMIVRAPGFAAEPPGYDHGPGTFR